MHLKFSVVNVAEPTCNAFFKEVSNSVHQSFVVVTEKLFEKAVPIEHLKIFNLGARKGGDVHFLIARLYSTVLD